MLLRKLGTITLFVASGTLAVPAADYSCDGLVQAGDRLICSGFEPNWALELTCDGASMSSAFIDAFSGDDIVTTPGTVTFATRNPWSLSTSHGIEGTIAFTPGGCTDESDAVRDFTFTPAMVPGLSGPFFPFCCRME